MSPRNWTLSGLATGITNQAISLVHDAALFEIHLITWSSSRGYIWSYSYTPQTCSGCLMFLFLSLFYIVKADIDCVLATETVSLREWVSVYAEVPISAVSLPLLTPCYAFVHPSLIWASPVMLGYRPQLFLYLIIWDRISLLNLEFTISARLTGQEAQDLSAHHHPQVLGL